MKNNSLKAIDFFCSGGGMSYGLQQAGIKVLAGIDNDPACEATYRANIKGADFFLDDVFELSTNDLRKRLSSRGLKRNDKNLILIGCTPCQFWSTIRTDKSKASNTKNLLTEFHRFVEYFKPGYVIVENVPGIVSRGKESGLSKFITWLYRNDYQVHFGVHDINEYGVPQNRKRFTLVANRVSKKVIVPKKAFKRKVLKDVLGVKNGFAPVPAGHRDETDFQHTVAALQEITLKRIKKVRKNGGTRFDFANDPELQLKCFVGKDNSFTDTFGRMEWEKPAPTITTKFFSVSCGRFVHPEEDRAISLREGATIQTFPKSFVFKNSSIAGIARIIGNAVPPEYARRIGKAIVESHAV